MEENESIEPKEDPCRDVRHPFTGHWLPGRPANPGGVPPVGGRRKRDRDPSPSPTKALKKLLTDPVNGPKRLNAIASVGLKKAIEGDFNFWRAIMERLDGKVPDKIEGQGDLRIIVQYGEPTKADEDAAEDAVEEVAVDPEAVQVVEAPPDVLQAEESPPEEADGHSDRNP